MARPKPETAKLARMLGKVPLFSGLSERELEAVAGAGREVSFESGKKILEQGEQGLSFLLVLEGEVEVRKKGRKVATLEPGGFFGEMTVIDDKPRSADIVAIKPTKCLGIPSWSFFPLLRSNPDISIGIIKELVRRLRQVDESQFQNPDL